MSLPEEVKNKEDIKKYFLQCRYASQNHDMHIAFLDFNKFKQVNDNPNLGHDVGDFVIEKVCKIILENTRTGKDILIRNGGDEFVIFLPQCSQIAAKEIINRISNSIATNIDLINLLGEPFTVSIGFLPYIPKRHTDHFKAIKDADKLMYIAKNNPPSHIHYSQDPDDLDLPRITWERNKTLKGILKRDVFNNLFKYMLRFTATYNRELLLDALRIKWRDLGDEVIDETLPRLANKTIESYREVKYAYDERQKKIEQGLLSAEEMRVDLDPIKKSKRKHRDHELQQDEDLKKLQDLEEKIIEIKHVEERMEYKKRRREKNEKQAVENKKKENLRQEYVTVIKKQKEEERTQATKIALENKAQKIKVLAQKEPVDNGKVTVEGDDDYGRIMLKNNKTGEEKEFEGKEIKQ